MRAAVYHRPHYYYWALWTATASSVFRSTSSLSPSFVTATTSRRQYQTIATKSLLNNKAPLQRPSFPRSPFLTASSTVRPMSSSPAGGEGANPLRVALCQFPVTESKEVNHATARDYLDRAASQGAQLIVLPEIWNAPYATLAFPEYAEVIEDRKGSSSSLSSSSPSANLLREKALEHGVWIVGGSIPERVLNSDGSDNDKIYNTCLVFDPRGNLVAKHRKVHLFDINVPGGITFYESDTLSPGNTLSHFTTPDWGDIGLGICYDIRFAEYAMLLCQLHETCRILIYPGAFNLTTGPAHWELLQRARAVDNQCFVLTASPARTEAPKEAGKYPNYTAWGHSSVVSPWGDVVATIDEQPGIVVADLDLTQADSVRRSIPIRQQKRHDLYELKRTQNS